jgi:hypothetical protein
VATSRDHHAGHNNNIRTGDESFSRVEHLGITLTDQIPFMKKLRADCNQGMQNLLSSSLLSKRVKIKIFRSIILRIVLYGCETWSLALRVEYRLEVFENRVLRRIFGTKRDGVTGEWRKLHYGELCDVYSSPDIFSVISSRRVG